MSLAGSKSRRLRVALVGLVALLASCGDDGGSSSQDAAVAEPDAAPPVDAGPVLDASPQLGSVDISLSGCESGLGTEEKPCIGRSPLRLRFGLLAAGQVDTQLWDFGDGSDPSTETSPEHTYRTPGSFNLSLNVEGPGGSAGVQRLAAVVVIPSPVGGRCEEDAHCSSGDCACDLSESCPAPLSEGVCALDCDDNATCGSQLCVELDATSVADESWRRRLCLPGCDPAVPNSCGEGRSCEALLNVDGSWSDVCFVSGPLRPIGASCLDADGALDGSLCASGQCLDAGQRGQCSTACDAVSCPAGSECATFAAAPGEPRCVASCASFDCDADPGLSCQAPGAGFSISVAPDPAGYCVP